MGFASIYAGFPLSSHSDASVNKPPVGTILGTVYCFLSAQSTSLRYTLDGILLLRYIVFVAWDVEVSDEFRAWYEDLSEDEVESVNYSVGLLEEAGPILGRPHVDLVQQSRHPNMKELRVQHQVGHIVSCLPSTLGDVLIWFLAAIRQAMRDGMTLGFR